MSLKSFIIASIVLMVIMTIAYSKVVDQKNLGKNFIWRYAAKYDRSSDKESERLGWECARICKNEKKGGVCKDSSGTAYCCKADNKGKVACATDPMSATPCLTSDDRIQFQASDPNKKGSATEQC